ncbi:hypothetical protein EBT25_03585, partial [bacterium]|nr:hypothetical protein [bacterium]
EDLQRRLAEAEGNERKVLEEKLKEDQSRALREAGLTDEDLQRRLADAEGNERKLIEEKFREEQNRALRESGLTDEDLQRRLAEAEGNERKVLEEKLKEDQSRALRETGLTDEDIQRRLAETEGNERKALEEKLREDQAKKLRDTGLTDENIQKTVTDAVNNERQALEEKLREDQSRALREAGFTDENIQRILADAEGNSRKVLEEKLREDQSRTLRESGLTDEDIQKRLTEAEGNERKVLEEKLREDQANKLRQAGLTDQDIQNRVSGQETDQRRLVEEKLRTQRSDLLSSAGFTDQDTQRRVSEMETKQRQIFEEKFRTQRSDALTAAGLTDEDITRRVSEFEVKNKKLFEEILRKQRADVLASSGLTDADIQRSLEAAEGNERKVLEENLRAEQNRKLSEAGLSDEDITRRVSQVEESQRKALEEKLRAEQNRKLNESGFTEEDIQRRLGLAEGNERKVLEEKLREAQANKLREAGLTDADIQRRLVAAEANERRIFEEKLRKQRSDFLSSAGFSDEDTQRRVFDSENITKKVFEEKLRKQRADVLSAAGLTEADIQRRVSEVEASQRKVFEEKLRKQRSDVLYSLGLKDSQIRATVWDFETINKRLYEEILRNKVQDIVSGEEAKRRRITNQHTRTSAYEIERMVVGEAKRGEDGRVDQTQPRNEGIDVQGRVSTRAMVNFSHLETLILKSLDNPLIQSVIRGLFVAKKTFDAVSDNAISRTLDKFAATKAGKALATGFEAIGDFLDFAQIVMTFTDAAFYGQFPDENVLFTADRMAGYFTFTLKSQLDLIDTFNDKVDRQNENTSDYGYPYAHVQFPLINGPLTQVDMNVPGFEGDIYYNQTRIETEIDAVREYLLRTTEPFKSSIITAINAYLGNPEASNLISVDATQSFVSWLNYYDPEFVGFTDRLRDNLYEMAYSNVCLKYDGIVYVDRYKTDPIRKGRKRFQCGFKSPQVCNQNTVRWYDSIQKGVPIGGEYAEWYTYDELLRKIGPDGTSNILALNTFDSYTISGNIYANDQASVTNGQNGACMIMNSTVYGICYMTKKDFDKNYSIDHSGAGYDFNTHTCAFTPAYCQSLGACYSRRNRTCELPTEDLDGISILFGTGGPREFIRQHGCTIEDGLGQTDPLKVTRAGLGMIYEALHRIEDWGPGLKASLASPTGGLMFATAAMGVAVAGGKGAVTKIPGFGKLMGGAAITLMVLIAVESLQGVYEQRSAPIDDPLEYTIGGWRTRTNADVPSDTGKAVRPMGFLDGWVTKPIKYHPPGNMNSPYPTVDAFPVKSGPSDTRGVVVHRSMFATQASGRDIVNKLSTCLPDTQAVGRLSQAVEYSTAVATLGLSLIAGIGDLFKGSVTCPEQYRCYRDVDGYPQFSFMRAASRAEANQMYCIQPFPIMSPEQDLHDPDIGPLAGPSTEWLTSNIWTSGEDPYTPTYPMASATHGPDSDNRWYYQLVYDKKQINRSVIWDTAKLQKYFDDTTISYIRQGTCFDDFYSADGSTADPRCFGYLQVALSNYKFNPMTLMGGG